MSDARGAWLAERWFGGTPPELRQRIVGRGSIPAVVWILTRKGHRVGLRCHCRRREVLALTGIVDRTQLRADVGRRNETRGEAAYRTRETSDTEHRHLRPRFHAGRTVVA